MALTQKVYHPHLTGTYNIPSTILFSFPAAKRCDGHGVPLPPSAPPEVPTPKPDNNWSPFSSRAGFELAEFMFTDAELSQRKSNTLLELWAAMLIPHGGSPPTVNHRDLCQQIDAIELRNVPWETAHLNYNGLLPETTRPPEWMTTTYKVCYWNPHEVIKSLLACLDLDGHIDYVAHQEFDDEGR